MTGRSRLADARLDADSVFPDLLSGQLSLANTNFPSFLRKAGSVSEDASVCFSITFSMTRIECFEHAVCLQVVAAKSQITSPESRTRRSAVIQALPQVLVFEVVKAMFV